MCAAATTEPATTPLATWEELMQQSQSSEAGRKFARQHKDRESGLMPHTDAKVRYFGTGQEKPRVMLYRDSAAWCPYCQKVWLLLEGKEVNYATSKINMRSYGDKPDEFLRKVPRGLLPAIEIDGQLMTESLEIMFTIERTFPNPSKPMFPPSGRERSRAMKLLELERAVFGAWCSYLFRPEVPFIGKNTSDFESALRQMDLELSKNTDSDWFLPYKHPTIVDMQYVSHVERMVASALYYKGFDIRTQFENINRWLTAFEELPYYMATKSDFYTHCMDIPPQYGTPFPSDSDSAQRIRALLNPTQARLPVLADRDPELWTAAQSKISLEEHSTEAAYSLIRNHEAVARFCCRGAGAGVGDWGRGNPYRSSLADPYARPNEGLLGAVDASLRALAAGLLRSDPKLATGGAREATDAAVGPRGRPLVADCLAYLLERVGVPRDMQMPASKMLRAYLGEVVAVLRG